MTISWLFWWVYQLPIIELLSLFYMCTFVFLWVHHRLRRWRWLKEFLCVVLMLWATAVLWNTVLNRSSGNAVAFCPIPFYSYWEAYTTGNREILRSSFMNVALFYPAGLLFGAILPKHWSVPRRVTATAAVFAVVSLSIEVVQYTQCLGKAEIDDVIHNILGAVIGCMPLLREPDCFLMRKSTSPCDLSEEK